MGYYKKRALLIDIIFLSIIGIFSEIINYYAINKFATDFYFSISLIVVFIAMFRWGKIGILISPIIGFAFSILLHDVSPDTYLVYIIGNMGIALAYLLLHYVKREKIIDQPYWAVLYVFAGFIGIILVRSFVWMLLGTNIIWSIFYFTSNEALTIIIVSILFVLLRNQGSVMVDMNKLYEESE